MIHRDRKHEHIFLVADRSVRVLDFGVAKVTNLGVEVARSAGTQTGTLLGTPLFLSPEQVGGEKDISQYKWVDTHRLVPVIPEP